MQVSHLLDSSPLCFWFAFPATAGLRWLLCGRAAPNENTFYGRGGEVFTQRSAIAAHLKRRPLALYIILLSTLSGAGNMPSLAAVLRYESHVATAFPSVQRVGLGWNLWNVHLAGF